ncbi:PREDICTED: protein PXR1 [Trachymyrmex cornetzi]|uniref:protein PXR1 n=1 Tax=Trachymyrmex cornetzi TaxID=471704 RepID=UPI00084ED31D|nr:PREDICTED: protein PXR1 [Trachymyrmex cornetzi]
MDERIGCRRLFERTYSERKLRRDYKGLQVEREQNRRSAFKEGVITSERARKREEWERSLERELPANLWDSSRSTLSEAVAKRRANFRSVSTDLDTIPEEHRPVTAYNVVQEKPERRKKRSRDESKERKEKSIKRDKDREHKSRRDEHSTTTKARKDQPRHKGKFASKIEERKKQPRSKRRFTARPKEGGDSPGERGTAGQGGLCILSREENAVGDRVAAASRAHQEARED